VSGQFLGPFSIKTDVNSCNSDDSYNNKCFLAMAYVCCSFCMSKYIYGKVAKSIRKMLKWRCLKMIDQLRHYYI